MLAIQLFSLPQANDDDDSGLNSTEEVQEKGAVLALAYRQDRQRHLQMNLIDHSVVYELISLLFLTHFIFTLVF